jgi:hypothetical protein
MNMPFGEKKSASWDALGSFWRLEQQHLAAAAQ